MVGQIEVARARIAQLRTDLSADETPAMRYLLALRDETQEQLTKERGYAERSEKAEQWDRELEDDPYAMLRETAAGGRSTRLRVGEKEMGEREPSARTTDADAAYQELRRRFYKQLCAHLEKRYGSG